MFSTIVIALDLERQGDRALPVVRALTELADVDVELVTVSSPGLPEDVDGFELSRRATANGWPAHSYAVLHGDDAAAAIADHVRGRSDVLLVMATTAKRPLVGHVLGSVSEGVLRRVDCPVLLVGPSVPATIELFRPTLVICVDPVGGTDDAVDTIASWVATFPGGRPWVAEVLPTSAPDSLVAARDEGGRVRQVAAELAAHGVDVSSEVLHGGDPATWLEEFATMIVDPILLTTSRRLTDSHLHWHSETREIVQRSYFPVLVAPRSRAQRPAAVACGHAST